MVTLFWLHFTLLHTIISSTTIITSSTNYEWFDDYSCGSAGWSNCLIHSIANNSYHGIYRGDEVVSTTEHITLSRDFSCDVSADVYVSFWVGFDCHLDGSTTDGVSFYFDSLTPSADCCDFAHAINGTLQDESLPSFQGQCNKNQPWLLLASPMYSKAVVGATHFTLKWDIATSDIDHEIIIYNIYILCDAPTQSPTKSPSKYPTKYPTKEPSLSPTFNPTDNPSTDPTMDPTQDPTYDPIGIVTYQWTTQSDTTFIHDAYSRFQISIALKLQLLKSLNAAKWFYIDVDTYIPGNNWTQITSKNYKLVNIYTAQIVDVNKLEQLGYNATDMVYSSVLTINALRVLNSGYCYNTSLAPFHLIQPGRTYAFKLKIVADSIINDRYDEYFESDVLSLSTNQFATNGNCIMRLLNPKVEGQARLLDRFYFDCNGWQDPDSIDANFTLKFNGLMNDVLINNELLSESWTNIPSDIIGMIGTKALEIKTLIRDDLGAVTCYDINVDESFPDAELTDEEILEAVKRVIRENSLGKDNSIAVALDSILEGLLYIGYANADVLQQIMDLIVQNVVDTSYAINQSETSSSRVISEATMVRGLLSEDSLIFTESASLLVDIYLPSLFNAIDAQIIDKPAIALDNSIGDSLNVIGVKGLDLAGKLERFMSTDLTQFDINHNKVLESFVEFGAYSGHIALAQSYPGSVFEYKDKDGERTIITTKIDPNITDNAEYQFCGQKENNIMIPNGITDSFFDCSFVDQKTVLFESDNNPKRALKDAARTLSNTITINLYNGDIAHSVFDLRSKRRRRRLEQTTSILELEASHLESTAVSDTCNPFWITIDLIQNDKGLYADGGKNNGYSLSGSTPYPSCTFWNISLKRWDTNNCFVYNYTSSRVLCACQHLTTFNVKAGDFKPKTNMVTLYHFRALTKDNLMQYPVVWISLIIMICIFIFVCLLFPGQHKDNMSPLAYQDIIFRPIRDMKTKYYLPSTTTYVFNDIYDKKHHEYGLGLIKSIRSNICVLQLRLYKIYLYDMHTLLSVFQHSEGTNYSKRERLGSFFLYLCTIMVSSAVFYGVEQQGFGDITASFLISLWSTAPAFITKKSFIKAKPKIIPFKINIMDVDYDKINKNEIDLSKLPLKKKDINRYDDDRYSLKIYGFKRPILKETVEKEVAKYGEYNAFRMANTRSHCYVIFKSIQSATKCKQKMDGIKYPKNVSAHQTGTLSTVNVPKIEAMAFIHQIDETELRQQWRDEHGEQITEQDIEKYNAIWPKLEAANGDFIGVDKYMMSEMVRIVYKAKDKTFHIALLDYLRTKLLSKDQKWPHFMKYFGWTFLLLWCGGCCLLAIVYGISFDVEYEIARSDRFSKDGYDRDCWRMNPQLIIQDELTKEWLKQSVHQLNNNFNHEIGDSTSWLIQLVQSTLVSIFIWQPITIYFVSWLMIWLFSWNLPVLLKPKNLLNLLKKICGIMPKNAEAQQLNEAMQNTTKLKVQMTEIKDINKKKLKHDVYSLIESKSISVNRTPLPSTPADPNDSTVSLTSRYKSSIKPPSITLPKDSNTNKKRSNTVTLTPETPKKDNITPKTSKKKRSNTVVSKDTSTSRKNARTSDQSERKKKRSKSLPRKTAPSSVTPPKTPQSPNTPKTPNTPRTLSGKNKKVRVSIVVPTTPKSRKAVTPTKTDGDETRVLEAVRFKKGGTKIVEKMDKDSRVATNGGKGGDSVFLVAVHHEIENTPMDEKEWNAAFDIEYGSDRYQKIVTKEQRPFDVFSFFGAEIFFLDVMKSEDGNSLDIKGYGNEYIGDKEIVIEEMEEKVQIWRSAVDWHS